MAGRDNNISRIFIGRRKILYHPPSATANCAHLRSEREKLSEGRLPGRRRRRSAPRPVVPLGEVPSSRRHCSTPEGVTVIAVRSHVHLYGRTGPLAADAQLCRVNIASMQPGFPIPRPLRPMVSV